jgi:hypothetical protein
MISAPPSNYIMIFALKYFSFIHYNRYNHPYSLSSLIFRSRDQESRTCVSIYSYVYHLIHNYSNFKAIYGLSCRYNLYVRYKYIRTCTTILVKIQSICSTRKLIYFTYINPFIPNNVLTVLW